MNRHLVVAGTDTGIGKTVFSAALAGALNAFYWKPIQSGLEDETDTQAVLRLSEIPSTHVIPELYRLKTPASPHLAAELDGIAIDPARLVLPTVPGTVVVEGAGGLMVPLTRQTTYIDQMARWGAPVVLCARTTLGTINHTLLSVEALRHRGIPLLGVAFIGDEHPDSERTIVEMGNVKRLGRLPSLAVLTQDTLRAAFAENFAVDDFLNGAAG
ncbi:dethiobiotin synthetase [Nitrobacteraceae bacterium AZCC 1564]